MTPPDPFLGLCRQTFLLQNFIFAKYEKESRKKYIKSQRSFILLVPSVLVSGCLWVCQVMGGIKFRLPAI